jgi:hypothetical protein
MIDLDRIYTAARWVAAAFLGFAVGFVSCTLLSEGPAEAARVAERRAESAEAVLVACETVMGMADQYMEQAADILAVRVGRDEQAAD